MTASQEQILIEIATDPNAKAKDREEAGKKLLKSYVETRLFQEIREISLSKDYLENTKTFAIELLPKSISNYLEFKSREHGINFTFALEMQDIMFFAGKNDAGFLQVFSGELLNFLSKTDKTLCLFEAVLLLNSEKVKIDLGFLENLSNSIDLKRTLEIIDELFIAEKFLILGIALNGLQENCKSIGAELQAIREKKKNFLLSIIDKYAKEKNTDKLEEIALSNLDAQLCNYACGLLIDSLSKEKSVEKLERLLKMQFSEPVLKRIKNAITLIAPYRETDDLSEKGSFGNAGKIPENTAGRKKAIL